MKRALLFGALLALFVLWTFPHRKIVERLIAHRLRGTDVQVTLGDVSIRLWPLGYTLEDVVIRDGAYSLAVDELAIGLGLGSDTEFHATACGGSIEGRIGRAARSEAVSRLLVRVADVDPGSCLSLDTIALDGSFSGVVELRDLGHGVPSSVLGALARTGSLVMEGTRGNVSGHLPIGPTRSGSDGTAEGTPIGSWEFANAALRARLDGGEMVIEGAAAEAEGVKWEVMRGRLASSIGKRVRVTGELRARSMDDSARAKAVLGLLPRATEAPDGWRRYRVSGTADAPRVIGLK